jgi:hypothetical protein
VPVTGDRHVDATAAALAAHQPSPPIEHQDGSAMRRDTTGTGAAMLTKDGNGESQPFYSR